MPRDSKTRYVVLGLLASGPMSGYDIKKQVEERVGHFWQESFGQIYPTLRRLCAERLARRTAKPNGGRERHVYRITPAGVADLRRWLVIPPDPMPRRNELLLKLFFGRKVDPAALMPLVEATRAAATRQADEYAALETVLPSAFRGDPNLPYWLLTLRSGVHVTRARIAWAEETLGALQEMARPARHRPRKRTRKQ
jgi:PadR family transcriptional regulator AphA